jgi:uncharacterized protein (TIGR00251 family)
MAAWWRAAAGGLTLAARLTPKGGRDAIDGSATGSDGRAYLKARVSAPPQDGKANGALIDLVARRAGVAKSSVTIIGGQTSRLKTLHIACAAEDCATIAAKIAG